MAINNLGMVRPGSTIIVPFSAFTSDDPAASVIISDFVLADIGIYKGTSMDERGSTTGVVLLDTDGINLDGATGVHGFTIDLSSNATADFYTAGSHFYVTVGPFTIDAATINFVAATFSIGQAGAVHNTTIATLASQTSFTLTAGPAEDDAFNGYGVFIQDIASAIQVSCGYVLNYTGGTKTVTLKVDPAVFTFAAADHISFFMPTVVPTTLGNTLDITTTGAAGIDWANVENKATTVDLSDTSINLCDTVTTNTDVRGTDSAATAASLATLTDALILTSATIETVTSQTVFVIPDTADATDNDVYNGAVAVFIDGTDPNQKSIRLITDYVASSRSVTVSEAPDFTITTADTLTILSASTARLLWQLVLTGADQNFTNSAGRRLRQIQEAGGYTLGHVYIDTTANGTSGTTDFENGVDINPVDSIGDANTIAASVGLTRFSVSPASSITFAASQANDEFHGENWTLALGSQAIGGVHIEGANVTGTGTCASEAHFEHCELGTMTIGIAHFDNCDIEGTITLAGAGTYRFFDCRHSGTAVIDFGTEMSVNMTVHIHGYNGALTIENLGNSGTDVLHFDSSGGQLTLASSCVAGTVNFRGTAALVNNGSGMTINRGGDVVNDVAGVQSDTDDIQTRLPAALSSGNMKSDALAISGSTEAADNLEASAEVIVVGAAEAGTLSTTVMTTDLTEATDEHYNGRIVIWTSGVLQDQASDITAYLGSTGKLTYTAVTEAPSAADTFIIV